jgi:hypothetical protein
LIWQDFLEGLSTHTTEKGNVNKERKKRGDHRLYSIEDAKWEEQIRQEIEKKKKKVWPLNFKRTDENRR